MQIIDGKKLAGLVEDEIVKEIVALKGERPNLAIVLVGDRQDSELYVSLKEREAKKVGIDTHLYKCPKETSETDLLAVIEHLNNDELIDGILVQLPLPDGLDTDKIMEAVDVRKDVDGFHPKNLDRLTRACDDPDFIMPPVYGVVLEMLKHINFDLSEKQVCVLANSEIFGQTLARILECYKAVAEVVHPGDDNLSDKTKKADILISAIGRPAFVKKEMIKDDAVIIDVGITKNGKKVQGDVDFEDVEEKAAFISPVPGGVGPLTIALAFRNTLDLYKRLRK